LGAGLRAGSGGICLPAAEQFHKKAGKCTRQSDRRQAGASESGAMVRSMTHEYGKVGRMPLVFSVKELLAERHPLKLDFSFVP
jgi:hypothetical protein